MDKVRILYEVKRLAVANGGKPPGRAVFERETGIATAHWYPHLWLRWSDALVEAGYAANKLVVALSDEVVIQKYIALARELGKLPVAGELRRKAREDKTFPSHTVFNRWGGKEKLVSRVAQYCREHQGCDDVAALFATSTATGSNRADGDDVAASKIITGFVYLMKSGRHHKIGRTNALGRREWEIGIKIPIPPTTVHKIETDDPVGVEAYWHKRFSDKRGEGEWFTLSADDVRAFKRWKRIV